MIITSKLIWVHLPKTAGTTTERLFVASGLPLLWNDPQSSYVKHLPVSDHPDFARLPMDDQRLIVNFRRLPFWLLSNYHHKSQMMNLKLDFNPVRRGYFWRDRLSAWLPADWWLDRLSITSNCSLLRVDYLKADFLSCLRKYQPIDRLSRLRVRMVKSTNRNYYERKLDTWFSRDELNDLYALNPRWTELELLVYGNLLSHI